MIYLIFNTESRGRIGKISASFSESLWLKYHTRDHLAWEISKIFSVPHANIGIAFQIKPRRCIHISLKVHYFLLDL